ncbi:hypothetical protein [Acuticoccus mangrovi]|uniref:Uncharacterized protein n=1 Tax=Acuticoccus mangrovi TaxID=2796142 RepID=A0A934IUC2_9HYPH|nr:hypothetical protein [Acuticoccus mangrovi]MBJ3777879.1 hypothetical protein [Acuticoccus mangrovi]
MADTEKTEPAPTVMALVDEFDVLESRVRFYLAASEKIAADGLSADELDPLVRGGIDLVDSVLVFHALLAEYHAATKGGAA